MKSRGFTLLEVLVALSILGIVSAGLVPNFIRQLKFNTQSEVRAEAIEAAVRVLDLLRLADPTGLPSSGSSDQAIVSIGDRDFGVTTAYCPETTYCTSNTRHLRVLVAYKNDQVYTVDTVFTKLK